MGFPPMAATEPQGFAHRENQSPASLFVNPGSQQQARIIGTNH